MNSKACLVDNGIKCVITMTPKKPTKVEGIVYVQFPFEDAKESDISTCFKEAHKVIENALYKRKVGVLVHCNAGVSRSATVVVSYIMQKLRLRYIDALTLVRKYRQVVYPNPGFAKQLQALEKRLFGENEDVKQKEVEVIAVKPELDDKEKDEGNDKPVMQ